MAGSTMAKKTDNLKRGNPGNRGGSGRPSEAFRERCRALIEQNWKTTEYILKDPDNRNYATTFRALLQYGYGMPQQQVEVRQTGKVVHTILLPPLGAVIPDAVVEAIEDDDGGAVGLPPLAHPGPTALQLGSTDYTVGNDRTGRPLAAPMTADRSLELGPETGLEKAMGSDESESVENPVTHSDEFSSDDVSVDEYDT